MRPYILAESNWDYIKDANFELAILPWGATEAHNFHLPYSTDNIESAGRTDMSDEVQALGFFAGANSIFYGEKLLTTPNPEENKDMELFAKLGIKPQTTKDAQQSAA